MKISITALALLVFAARPSGANPYCPPCPDGVTEVAAAIEADTVSWGAMGVSQDDWIRAKRPKGLPFEGIWTVTHVRQIPELFRRLGRQCKRIKHLSIASHGNLGFLSFGGGGISTANLYSRIPEQAACVMAADAHIDISGCNVGRGCRGEDFLMTMASLLLRSGGKIEAATHYTTTIVPGVVERRSANFDYQSLTVDAGPRNPRWDNTPQTTRQCQGRINDVTSEMLGTYRSLAERCSEVTDSDLRIIRGLGRQMLGAFRSEVSADPRGSGFSTRDHRRAVRFYQAFQNWFYFTKKYNLLRLAQCSARSPRRAPSEKAKTHGGRLD